MGSTKTMTTELRIMRGYSGGGKSTLAKGWVAEDPDNRVRVSWDDIRAMVTGQPYKTVLSNDGEALVTKVQTEAVVAALRSGKSVVVDDTNLRLKFARRWADLAVREGATFVCQDVTTDVETCQTRNFARRAGTSWVPAQVIDDQAKRFRMPWPEVTPSVEVQTFKPYVPDLSKPPAFGFDLDGTLALFEGQRGPYDSHLYHTDKVNPVLRDIMYALEDVNFHLIIFTGRSEDHREVVAKWLMDHSVPWDILVMRKSGDNRNDAIVKSELFDEFVAPHYNFLAQFDDRDRVVAALRAKGIPVYQVAEGNF